MKGLNYTTQYAEDLANEKTISAKNMKTVKMEIELTYDERKMHGDSNPERNDFIRDCLLGDKLELFCQEMGDTVGKIKATSVDLPIPKNKNQNNKKWARFTK